MWLRLLSLVLWAAFVQVSQTNVKISPRNAFMDGDVIIGILSSVHSTVDNLQGRVRPEEFTCSK